MVTSNKEPLKMVWASPPINVKGHQTQPRLKGLINVYRCYKVENTTNSFLDIPANIKMLTDGLTNR